MGFKPRPRDRKFHLTVELSADQYHALREVAHKRGKGDDLPAYIMGAIREQIDSDCNLISHVTRIWQRKHPLTTAQKLKLKMLNRGQRIYKFGDQFRMNGEHVDPRTLKALEDLGYIWWSSKKDSWGITEEGKRVYKELKKTTRWLY